MWLICTKLSEAYQHSPLAHSCRGNGSVTVKGWGHSGEMGMTLTEWSLPLVELGIE